MEFFCRSPDVVSLRLSFGDSVGGGCACFSQHSGCMLTQLFGEGFLVDVRGRCVYDRFSHVRQRCLRRLQLGRQAFAFVHERRHRVGDSPKMFTHTFGIEPSTTFGLEGSRSDLFWRQELVHTTDGKRLAPEER